MVYTIERDLKRHIEELQRHIDNHGGPGGVSPDLLLAYAALLEVYEKILNASEGLSTY